MRAPHVVLSAVGEGSAGALEENLPSVLFPSMVYRVVVFMYHQDPVRAAISDDINKLLGPSGRSLYRWKIYRVPNKLRGPGKFTGHAP